MLQTLFYIPHWLLDGPLLATWLVVGLIYFLWQLIKTGNSNEAWSFLPVYIIVAAVLHFVIPRVEVSGINPADPAGPEIPLGLAVRGYGVMLLTAILSGLSLTMARCKKIGVTPDQIIQLAFWMMICGIAGARLFFVIQKSDEFFTDGFSLNSLINVVNMTQGGLVVYGSLIGGTIAGLIFMRRHQMPVLKTVDLIAPGMVLGLAIGRLGCLMNGCCFGGTCDNDYPAITFPPGSPPYMRQLSEGELLGIKGTFDADDKNELPLLVEQVREASFAAKHGIQPGDRILISTYGSDFIRFQKQQPLAEQNYTAAVISSNNGIDALVRLSDLPARSFRVHPTQIYSAVNALLLCCVLWFYWTMKHYDGQVFALMLILYAVGRFLMEIVRQDERGQFGTSLTISQWVSIVMILIGFAMFAAVMRNSSGDENPAIA